MDRDVTVQGGNTALHYAAYNGHNDIVKFLADLGGNKLMDMEDKVSIDCTLINI